MGYSRLVLPAQLRGPFHVCNWIGLSAPAVRLSDQLRMTCTFPRQRLSAEILPHAFSPCQGQPEQKGPPTFRWVADCRYSIDPLVRCSIGPFKCAQPDTGTTRILRNWALPLEPSTWGVTSPIFLTLIPDHIRCRRSHACVRCYRLAVPDRYCTAVQESPAACMLLPGSRRRQVHLAVYQPHGRL